MSTFSRAIDIDASPAEVWRVLTARDLVREWAPAYGEDMDIVTSWRPGARVIWKGLEGVVREGVLDALEPERRLRFEYGQPPDRVWSETYEIAAVDGRMSVTLTFGPLPRGELAELAPQAEAALKAIRSLAEELATIRARRGGDQ